MPRLPTLVLFGALLAPSPAAAWGKSSAEKVAHILGAQGFANARCPHLWLDLDRSAMLFIRWGHADTFRDDKGIQDSALAYSMAYDEMGVERSCKEIVRFFGAKGVLQPNLIEPR